MTAGRTDPWISAGERRIRVITTALPTTSNLSEVFASADQVALATLLANKAVERSITHKLEDARDAVFNKMVEILTAYKASMTAAGAGASAQLAISENLKMLPVLLLGLLKNVSTINVNIETRNSSDIVYTLVGRNQAERTDPSRSQGVRSVFADDITVSTPHSLHSPDVLLSAQHATRGAQSQS